MKSSSQVDGQLAHQIGEERNGPLQDRDDHEVAPLVVAADLRAELGDSALEVLLGDEDITDRVVRSH